MHNTPPIQIDNIPAALRCLPNWVLHRNKVPMQASGLAASSTDPATWTTFETAMLHVGKFDGIGFCFSNSEFSGVDLDDVRNPDTGAVEKWASDIITALNSYCELSPSESGVHIIVRGKVPKAVKRQKIEIYPDSRYFTITGRRSSSVSANVETRDLSVLFARVQAGEFDTDEEKSEATKKSANGIHRDVIDLASTDAIPDGKRNDTLTRIAGKAAYEIGFANSDELYRYLQDHNQHRCTPVLPDAEVRTIAGSIFARSGKTREDETPLIGGIPVGSNLVKTAQAVVTASAELTTDRADQIKTSRIEWLWDQRIPSGKLTIFSGNPDQGKSLVSLYVASCVTTGRPLYSCTTAVKPCDVLILAGEDEPSDTIVPRLQAMQADLRRVHFARAIEVDTNGTKAEHAIALDEHLAQLEARLVANPAIRLVIIDPLSNYLGKANMNREQEVRKVLTPVKELAARRGVSFVSVMHFNKRADADAIHRTGGAMAFSGISRANWSFQEDSENPGQYKMLRVKLNVSRKRGGLVYRIDSRDVPIDGVITSQPAVEFIGETDDTAQDVLIAGKPVAGRAPDVLTGTKEWLLRMLSAGATKASEVFAAGRAGGHAERTIRRAKADLCVIAEQANGGWWWRLPGTARPDSGPIDPFDNGTDVEL